VAEGAKDDPLDELTDLKQPFYLEDALLPDQLSISHRYYSDEGSLRLN